MTHALAFDLFTDTPAPRPAPTHTTKVRAHRRTVRGEAGPSGRQLRDAALEAHEADDSLAEARSYVRARLAELYRRRAVAWAHKPERIHVTADDVADILDAWSDYPDAVRIRPGHWKGALFNPSTWEKTGQSITSSRPHMQRTRIECWKLREVSRG